MTETNAHGTADRPWLWHPSIPVDRKRIQDWYLAVDAADAEHEDDAGIDAGNSVGDSAGNGARTGAGRARSAALAAGISVVVPTHRGQEHIGRCLDSLARQTLGHHLFEIIVVLNGEPDETPERIIGFRAAHPSITLRTVQLREAGAAAARNAGIAAARRRYTTFVDDDDYVSPAFLRVLLDHARPRVVPVTSVIDVGPDGDNPHNYINSAITERGGDLVRAVDLPVATSFNAAKAVATTLLREISYDLDLRSGEDVVFWTTVAVRGRIALYPCPADEGATYYRVLRAGSVSRREMSFDFNVTERLEVISKLDRLTGEADAAGLELVHKKIDAQSAFIGDYLETHPDQHPRVVAALDRTPVSYLPYHRINAPLGRGLVVAYTFAPYADASAVVVTKRMRVEGRVADVVHNAMDSIRKVDDTLNRVSGPYVARVAALPTPTYFASWQAMEAFAVEGLKTIEKWESSRGPYEWLYSRAHFAASHLLAAAYKISHPDLPWSAEFSDPLSRDILDEVRGTPVQKGRFLDEFRAGLIRLGVPLPRSSNCLVWCEEVTYALADKLVFTNENQLEHMLGYCSNPDVAAMARAKAVVSPHPTLPTEFYTMVEHHYPLEEGVAHLGYFGKFYVRRGLGDVLSALAAGPPELRARVRVHVFTTKPANLLARAIELGVEECVRVGPYLRYLEFLNVATKFDCLIVPDAVTADNHGANPYLPSKWSDYRGAGAPVWGLVEDGSPLSAQRLDYSSPVGDAAAAGRILDEIVRRKRSTRPTAPALEAAR